MEGNWHHVVTVENLGGVKRKVNILYDLVGTKNAIKKASEQIAPTVQVKGFRKGKAPGHVIETFFRKEVESHAANLLATEGFFFACRENKIVPLAQPKVEKAEFKIDGSFVCEIIVDQKPTISPVGYVGLELTKPKINVSEIYDQVLTEQRNNFKKEISKEVLEDGNIAIVDFSVMDSENKEVTSGADQRFFVRVGQEPPFGENLLGKKVGDTHEGEISLPDGFGPRAGEKVNVFVSIKSVLETVELDDENLAKEMNLGSVEELNSTLMGYAQQEANNRATQILQETVVDKLLEFNEFEVPEEWVNDEAKYIYQQLKVNSEDEGLRQYVEGMALRNVRRTFVLDSIYDSEQSLAVTQEDVDFVIKAEAEKKGVSTLIVKSELQKNNMMDSVIGLIKNRKVMDFILSQASVVDEVENSFPVIEG